MIEAFIIIILGIFGFIGLGVFIGWCIWGFDAKYYKYLYEHYKTKYDSDEKARFQKQVKDALYKYMKDRYGERFRKVQNDNKRKIIN